MSAARTVRRLLTPPLVVVAVLVVLFEETFWRWMTALGGLVARIPLFAALERLVERLPPRLVFLLFIIPMAVLFPVKLLATWLLFHGHVLAGLALVGTLKVVGTAFSARLFTIAKPKLIQVASFRWLYERVTGLLDRAHAWLAQQPAWQATRAAAARVRGVGKALLAPWLAAGKRGLVALRFAAARRRARREMV